MKRLTSLVTALLVLAVGLSTARAVNIRYFDLNDNGADSGVVDNTGYAWNSSDLSWNPNSDGSGAGPGTTVAWVNGDDAVFSAGTDANGALYGINIAAGVTSNTVLVRNGTVQVTGNALDAGASSITVGPGAGVRIAALGGLSTTGKLVLDGGTITETNSTGTGGSYISSSKNLEVTANGGTVRYAPTVGGGSPNFSTFAIILNLATSAITGTGGTTTNGGVGTLTIDGQGNSEIRIQNAGTANSTFAKLKVVSGMFRFGNSGGQFETAAGAVPTSVLADAITLDGGFLGASWAISLDAKRGVVIGPNGGGYDNGGGQNNPSAGGAAMTINGPLSGSGELIVKGISNTGTPVGQRGGGLTLTNVANNTGFTGGLTSQGATLTLNESLTVTHLQGDHTLTVPPVGAAPTTPQGLITILTGKTLTFGSDNTDTAWDGQTSGAGSMTKVGNGTISLNSINEWGNTGGTNINAGTIKYTTSAAGLTGPVTIGATGKLNMNGVNDSFSSLAGPAGAIVDMKDTAGAPGNLTLSGATPINVTYAGTIVGGGNLTKSSSSTQKFAGNLALGVVALNGGSTIVNSPATMTATGGVTVAALGSLGGTGIIAGTVTNNGVIAPGDGGVGTLSVTGNVTEATGAILQIELSGASADKLAVTGNIDLSAAGDALSVTGAGTGSSWVIGTYTGSESGVFDSITSGYTVTYAGGNITLNAAVGFPGDFNNDGHLDAGDYVSIRKQFSDITTGPGLTAYTAWRQNYGNPPGAGSGGGLSNAPVPEPASLALLVIGLATFGLGRRNRVA